MHGGAPAALDVLPSHAARRLTRRDGLLPLVLAVELLAGVAFGLAGSSGSSAAAGAPAQLRSAPVPALVTFIGPMSPKPAGPPIGPLLPGQVRAPMPSAIVAAPAAPAAPVAPAAPAAGAAAPAAATTP